MKLTLNILEIKREKKGYLKNAFSGSFKTQIKQYEKKIEALPKYYEVDDEEQNTKFSDGFYVSFWRNLVKGAHSFFNFLKSKISLGSPGLNAQSFWSLRQFFDHFD